MSLVDSAILAGSVIATIALLFGLFQKIRSMRGKLARQAEMREESLANVSHELRKILTPMRGYTDLLLSGRCGTLSHQQKQFIKNVSGNLDRMQGLVDTLLELESLERPEEDLNLKWMNLEETLQRVVQDYRMIADAKKLRIFIATEGDLKLYGEPEKLRQVFSNLIANAVHYTLEGEIHIKAYSEGSDLYVQVQDTGIGIHPTDQERIFERFYRGSHHHVQKVAGSGLGLSIANSIVEKHKGKILVESKLGEGSSFIVVLPKEKRLNRRKIALKLVS
ncbi:MAG: HAMP domain-containing histidine kinase [Deltaproteobacteria bacterium]|nr:HAMP domain-containing histidine kinase [Deltaproteobacteria bacterium]